MLQLIVPPRELYDEGKNEFIYTKETVLQLEHSLLSISKWESKWHKPYFAVSKKDEKTVDEVIDYIRCMTLNKNVDPEVYKWLGNEELKKVTDYIEDSMTATTFRDDKTPPSREIITSELVYYWMVSLQIPFECEKWHFNRLMTLIRVCNIKNAPPKKMGKKAMAHQNHTLNRARKGGR